METSLIKWIVWAVVLIGQAGSSTWASRARNSQSVAYHGVAAIFSHGVWFISNVFMVDSLVNIARDGGAKDVVFLGLFYTVFCVIGSIVAHHVSANLFEKGNRRIGGAR